MRGECENETVVYVGIDVHRNSFAVCCLQQGSKAKRCTVPPTSGSVVQLVRKYFPQATRVKSCYESGYSGFWLHHELCEEGFQNIVVHAASIPVQQNDKVKTDKRDSTKLAKLLSQGALQGIQIPSPTIERMRILARHREQLMRARRRLQVQCRMRLHQFGLLPPTFSGVLRVKDVEALLENLPYDDITFNLELALEQWRLLRLQISQVDRLIRKRVRECDLCKVYQSVPGIGPLTAYVLATELGTMQQFANVKRLASFVGLTPSEYSSGDKTWKGAITRQGNSRLRYLLIEAAWKAVRKDPEMQRFFAGLSARTSKQKAIVAVARKLLIRVRALVRTKTNYQINFNAAV